MDSILSAINEYRIILGAVVLTFIALLLMKKFWTEVAFYCVRVWMNLPVIGKISRLAKQPGRDDSGWFHAEKDLCGLFRPFFTDVDKGPKMYDNCKGYLRKVGELGRKNLGVFGWIAISVMVFIEAMGFSYVLAGFTIPGASESLQQQGAVGIALLISGLLVALTHATGHELHKNSLIKKVRTWWSQGSGKDAMHPNNEVSLEHDTVDNGDPAWRQLLSRIETNAIVKPGYKITIATTIFVILVGVGATYVRGQVLETTVMEEHRIDTEASSGAASSDPYAEDVPAELMASQSEADIAVADQIMDANLKGGWATFIVLAVIFVFLQVLGVLIGFKTGFAGQESQIAYKYSHKFNNREEFEAYHERKRNLVSQVAQRNLTKLQAKMANKFSQTATDKGMLQTLEEGNGRTFIAYVRKDTKDKGDYDQEAAFNRRDRDANIAEAHHDPAPAGKPAAAPEPEQAPSPAPTGETHGLEEADIQHWMDKIGWDRQRTVDLLVKQREKKKAEQKPEISEEEALRMMEESNQ